MVKTLFTKILVLTCVFRYFWKWGNMKKGVHWNRRLRLFCTLWIRGFKKISSTLDTYVLVAKILQNGANFRYTKAGFKSYRNLNNLWQVAESPKSWNLMGFCPKKYIPSAKTLYKVDLSNINFNYLCVDSSNYLWYFLNHKSFFTTQLLRIFLTQTLHSFYKSSPSNCKFSDIPLLRLMFTKVLISFFK